MKSDRSLHYPALTFAAMACVQLTLSYDPDPVSLLSVSSIFLAIIVIALDVSNLISASATKTSPSVPLQQFTAVFLGLQLVVVLLALLSFEFAEVVSQTLWLIAGLLLLIGLPKLLRSAEWRQQ